MDESNVIELYRKYDTCRQVAEALGTNNEAVRRVLIKHGIKRTGNRPRKQRKTDKRMPSNCKTTYCAALVVMLRENLGLPTGQISSETSIPTGSVVNILNRKRPDLKMSRCQRLKDETIAAIERDYIAGASSSEIGEKYGIKACTVTSPMRKRGHVRGKGYCNTRIRERVDNEKRKQGFQTFIMRFNERYGEMFEYLGGYENSESKVRLKCLACGYEFDRYIDWKYKTSCPSCKQQEVDDRRKAKESAKEARREQELGRDKVCKECGRVYHNEHPSSAFCSKECRRKSRNRKNNSYRRRAREHNAQYDSSVTLERVFKRDRGICQICGIPCYWEDRGSLHPTIDHIVAFDNGGGHVWENVQLAHHLCNSYKRNLTDEEFTDEIRGKARQAVLAHQCARFLQTSRLSEVCA